MEEKEYGQEGFCKRQKEEEERRGYKEHWRRNMRIKKNIYIKMNPLFIYLCIIN